MAFLLAFLLPWTGLDAFSGFEPGLKFLLGWKAKPPVDAFLPAKNCTQWLQSRPTSITYNYGVGPSASGAQALLDCLQDDEASEIRASILEIVIKFPLSGQPDPTQQPLLDVIGLLPDLQTIRWPSARKRHLGRAILDQWRATLNPDWSIGLNDDVSSTYFLECNADSLDVIVSYGGNDAEHTIDHLYANLVVCTNVRSLSLTISQGGCEIDNTNPRSFKFRSGDTFPHLENLRISGYDWDSRKTTSWWTQRPSSLQAWRVAMDWSRLEHLDIDLPPISFLEAFSGPNQLGGLESLVLRPKLDFWGNDNTLCGSDENTEQLRQNYTSFIATLPPLRGLSIGGMGRSLDLGPILEAHGGSLKSLSLHEHESDCIHDTENEARTRPTLNVTQLRYLSKAAPHLEAMTLDLHLIEGEWPAATFEALSAFENLRDLTLHFDLGDHSRMKPVKRCVISRGAGFCTVPELMQPVLDQDAAQQIFLKIRGAQPGKKLQHVTLYAGDYGREEGGGLRVVAHYEHNRPVKFDCNVEEDGVEICEGWIGRNVDDGYEDPSDDDGYPKRITRALEPGESGEESYSGDQAFQGAI